MVLQFLQRLPENEVLHRDVGLPATAGSRIYRIAPAGRRNAKISTRLIKSTT
jgi:hypothetical protein